jgi:hypothetical protein
VTGESVQIHGVDDILRSAMDLRWYGKQMSIHSEFYNQDTYKGRAIYVRYVWLPKSARMEQFWSPDGGKTWGVNWIRELSR